MNYRRQFLKSETGVSQWIVVSRMPNSCSQLLMIGCLSIKSKLTFDGSDSIMSISITLALI